MKRQTIIRMATSVAFLFVAVVSAIADTSFKITEGVVDEKVKDAMETNVTALIEAFREAAEKGEKKHSAVERQRDERSH